HAAAGAGVDHAAGLGWAGRHRLLAEHVHAGRGGTLGVVAVHRVGQHDVDGIGVTAAHQVVILVVMEHGRLILLGQHRGLLHVAGHQGDEFRVVVGVGEGGQHGGLGEPAEAHHGVTNLLAVVAHHGNAPVAVERGGPDKEKTAASNEAAVNAPAR